ncbi:SDR family NAD(P)-dependent oxidoreductase [Acetobacterium sp.]|uniref:SDR family NAD(P)-dependent oxidoreductase n=1 Tax=Acetobacterium sp. TaxID=1872094 RepID=UPI002F41FEE7
MKKIEIALDKKSRGLIVITGCDSGVGKSLVLVLLQMGYKVILSYLDQNPFENEPNVYSRKMDFRKPEEVVDFCHYVKDLCQSEGKLEAVIANAGVALGGSIENLPMSIYRECFEINFFGVIEIIQALIPELIRDKGKIMIHGSMAGRVALPFLSPYVSTKFALEGFCDSLRREMNPFGIKTILLESAAIATPIWNKAKNQDISFVDKKYLKSLYLFRDKFIDGGNSGMDRELAALKIAGILDKKNPKARYIISKNKASSKLLLLMPSFVLDKAVVKMYEMDYGDHA